MKFMKLSISLFFLLYLFNSINCQTYCDESHCISNGLICQDKESNSCGVKCRPKYGDNSKCYLCDFEDGNYYIDGVTCYSGCTGKDYIIDFSKECTSDNSITGLFLMGSIYYKKCPLYSKSTSSNQCHCENKYYIETNDGREIYHCLSPTDICPSEYNYYNYGTNECYSSTDCRMATDIQKMEANGNIRCHTSCIGDEFHKIQSGNKICVDSCDKYTYIDPNDNKKYCVENCKLYNPTLRQKNNYCIPKTQCDFYDDSNDQCLNSCEESSSKHYHNFDSNECILNCNANSDNYIYSKNNICYKEENCQFIQEDGTEKKCLSKCELEEGFKLLISGHENKCYTSCSEAYPYYNHGSNLCIEKCSISGNDKIYHKVGEYECFASCKEIGDGTFIYMKVVNGDGICYSSSPCTDTNDYYYTISNQVKKCALEEDCTSLNYKYLKGRECIEECNDYKGYDDSIYFVKCFEMNECFSRGYKYYNTAEKKCWKSLPYGYCIKNNDDPNKIEVIPLGENYYYQDSSLKYCVNSCHSKGKYIDFIDKKKCIDKCSKTEGTDTIYYYFDPRNYECLETCIGSGLEFAYAPTSTSTNANPCRIDNDGKFYYENDKLIRESCDFYKSIDSKICVPSCQSNEKIFEDRSKKQCVNRCPSTHPYLDENNYCKMASNCPYVNEEGDKCLSSCNIGQGFYILASTPPNNICYSNCPFEYGYHDFDSNKCIQKCGDENNSYKSHIDGEIICYPSCNVIPAGPNGKYLYQIERTTEVGINICSDNIPIDCQFYYVDEQLKKCTSACSSYKFKKGKECTNECYGFKANYVDTNNENVCFDNLNDCFSGAIVYNYYNIYSKMCWNSLPSGYYIKTINDLKYEVVQDCGDLLKYEDTVKKCITLEQCLILGKYKNGDTCDSCNNFIYNSECVSSCGTGTGHDYYNHGSKLCISSCSGEYSYQKENDINKECYRSCNDIDSSGTYNYLKGNICSNIECLYYRELDTIEHVKNCYQSEEDCIKAGFEYIKGKQCIYENECSSTDYKVKNIRDTNGKIISLGKCYSNTNDCKNNGYYYYNSVKKECWYDTCKYDLHIMELGSDGHPTVDDDRNTCVDNCPSGYHLLSNNYCKMNCQNYLDVEEDICVSDCGEKYILNTNKCTSSCHLYFINNSGKKECLSQETTDTCFSESKYYFSDNPSECLNECYKILNDGTKQFYFYNSENKCLLSCLDNTLTGNFIYANEPNSIHQECKDTCGTKYYYENENICREESCILFKESDSKICVTECGPNQKVDGNKCVDDCPSSSFPFFVEEKIEIKGIERTIKKCINTNCQDYSAEYNIIYASSNGKECLKTCHEGFYQMGNYCFRNCEGSNKYIDIPNYTCSSACSTDYYEKIPGYSDIYICKNNCDLGQFKVEYSGKFECVSECPQGKNHVTSENECKEVCETTQLKIIKDIKEDYTIYECIALCPDDKFYSETNKRCYSICKGNDIGNPFSLTVEDSSGTIIKRKCHNSCIYAGDDKYKYYEEDKICIETCTLLIEQDTNRCTENCDNDYYKYEYNGECLHECPNNMRYLSPNYECIDICPGHKNYFPQNGYECIAGCEEGQYKEIILDNTNQPTGEYRCVSNYGEKKYYKEDRILIDECLGNHYVIQDTNECIENCDLITSHKYYYYDPENDDPNIHEKTCVLTCSGQKPFMEDNHCKHNCEYKLKYKQGENICLAQCPDNFYDKGDGECVNSCKNENLYLYNGECIKYCPYGENQKKFYIEPDNECLFDCNEQNQYFTETEIDAGSSSAYKKYECHGDCTNYYIINQNPSIIAKQCLEAGKTCETENLYSNANNEKECYYVCPSNKYIDETEKKCLNQCENYKYHEINSKLCKEPESCDSKFADFETKTCVSKCNTKYISEIKDGGTVAATICLNNCNDEHYGIYSDPDFKCINNCNTDFSPNSQLDSTNTKCVCKNLYYFDEEEKKTKCLPDDISHCYDDNNPYPYKIQLYGTFQCLNRCDYISSLNGEYCYKNEEDACKDDLDIYSILRTDDTGKRCVCPYKFYRETSGKKHCLEEFSECSLTYSLYVPETMECVNNCGNTDLFKKQFKIFCLRICPFGSTEVTDQCTCDNLWYTSGSTYICLGPDDLCPDDFPVYAPQTKQCLKKCKGSYYPYLFEDKCYTGCEANIQNTEGIIIYSNDLAKRRCVCKKPWYYNAENEMQCPSSSDSINFCSEYNINLNFMIHETKQCLEKCPINYPYFFNNECFENCENHAEPTYNYIKKEGSYECQCVNLWYYENAERTRKKCIDYINYKYCFKFDDLDIPYLIYDTKECIDNCPSGMHIFNFTCYDKCPKYTKELETPEDGNTCTCNKDIDSFWYEYIIELKKFFVCGIEKCPINYDDDNHNRPNLLEEKKQCLLSCKYTSFPVSLRNICIQECPPYTKTNDDKCEFYDLNDESKVTDKESLKNYANVQAKELYEKTVAYGGIHLGGYLFNKFEDVSLQVYAIDKQNSLKELSTKSNLTYIDLNTCLEKIYSDQGLKDEDKIIVAKYDIKKNSNQESGGGNSEGAIKDKYLINQVEYEMFNSHTMEQIDLSVCDPYEIIVSYPIVFNKNKYNNYESGFNNNEYKKKFEIGKELYKKNNEVDTFDLKNSLYKDLCVGIEINGKDLILEDRYEYLYPNGALLCESNCTFKNTDFDEERINCKCTYKMDFDFDRVEQENNDLVNDPNYYKPGQSSLNLEVVKCLSKLTVKNAIINNEAFYYCTTITLAIASMAFVTGFYSIKIVSKNIINLYNKIGNKLNKIEFNRNDKKIPDKNEYNINTTHRALNNPPKKTDKNNNESESNERENIIINKNINIDYNINTNDLENDELDFSYNNKNKILDSNSKAEFIPSEFNFKFFKSNDKGVKQKIVRNKIPFDIKPDTKYLLERKKEINYPKNYLNGPFLSDQNIIEIINENSTTTKYKKNEYNNNYINNIDKDEDKELKTKKIDIPKINFNQNFNNENNNLGSKDKDIIRIRKILPHKNNKINGEVYNDENGDKDQDNNEGLYTLIKREQTYLRLNYNRYFEKKHPNILAIFLAEILDKVYLVKTCLFLKKFEIFSIYLSLYLFCHILLLSLICSFFTIDSIKKIWEQANFPDLQYYLLYGFISNIIVWIIYKIFLCLLDIQDKIKELIILNKNDINNGNEKDNGDDKIDNKLEEIMNILKYKIITFYIFLFIFIILCGIYLISFFAVYTGTKSNVLNGYLISIIEILLIKFVYGICLASLRIVSSANQSCLYKIVYIFDKYVS